MSSPSLSAAQGRPDAVPIGSAASSDPQKLQNGTDASLNGLSKADKVDTPSNGFNDVSAVDSSQVSIELPALLRSVENGKVGLFAVFGGQGPAWLDELRSLYTSTGPARQMIEEAAAIVLEQSQKSEISAFYRPYGFNLVSWLQSIDVPPSEYLCSAPVSCAMILLTQMATYLVTCLEWHKTPSEARKMFHGATGHSQGLLGATLFSMATTNDELVHLTLDSVRFMVWFGSRLQQATPFSLDVREEVRMEAKQLGYTHLSPMMAVMHLDVTLLTKYINIVNKSVANHATRQIQIGLKNAATINIVVGHPESLLQLAALLHRAELPQKNNMDQNRVPFSKRKRRFLCRFLNVTVPFHHTILLSSVADTILSDASNLKFQLDASKMTLPVYGSCGTPSVATDPTSLPKKLNDASTDLLRTLIHLQAIAVVDWVHTMRPIAAASGITHLVDFGHGAAGGIGGLCARLLVGAGVQTISAGATSPEFIVQSPSDASPVVGPPLIQDRSALFDSHPSSVLFATNWAAEYAPRLIMTNGKPMLDTKYTRALGKPPVMVAGMTPTTVNHELVAAVLNAGFHGELAGGGLPTEKMFRAKIDALVAGAHPGAGVTLNLLFLNPSQWGMQFPLVVKLAKEGVPIEGITIGAGVPSLEKATEIIQTLRSAGLRHIGFKPGSADTIRQVIAIAQANPEMTVLLQWTGGRGGGHHSFEDFHEPLISTYAEIRRVSNLVLIGGSGFGDAKDSWPYMDGTWSLKLGHPPMPFDAILVASRVMVALEAGTSTAVKELIVATPGIEHEAQWEQSYDGNAGGVVNVLSELGEPIHNVATRGVMLWRQFDKEFFSLPKDKLAAKIEEKKRWIIERLNADFQKVYFGKKFDGTVCDLEDMTYAEVAFRMVELQFIYDEGSGGLSGRWIHDDYLHLVKDFLSRIEERFIGAVIGEAARNGDENEEKPVATLLGPLDALKANPHAYLTELTTSYPESTTQLLSSEDVDYFISLCRKRGRKPVNFVPIIDKELSYWFKKDSLWQSEDIGAVQDQDVQRVVILQGPMAVRYSTRVNEPVADILNGIHSGWVNTMVAATGTELSQLPTVDNLVAGGLNPSVSETLLSNGISRAESVFSGYNGEKTANMRSLVVTLGQDSASIPTHENMLSYLASQSSSSWWRSVLQAPFITQDRLRQENILSKLFTPRAGQKVQLAFSGELFGDLSEVLIFEPNVLPTFPHTEPFVVISFDATKSIIRLRLHHKRPVEGSPLIPLDLFYRYLPHLGHACIHELTDGKNERVKKMYSQLWFNELSLVDASPLEAEFVNRFTLSRENIVHFCQSIGRPLSTATISGSTGSMEKAIAPVDIAIVAGWESIIKSLFLNAIDADILKLVHLSNSFKRLSQVQLLEGDELITKVRITEIANTPTGQRVAVGGTIGVQGSAAGPVIGVQSQFFIRGNKPLLNPFHRVTEERIIVLSKKETVGILKSKSWAKWHQNNGTQSFEFGDRLVFRLESCEMALPSGLFNIRTTGTIVKQSLHAKLSTTVDGDVIGTFDSNEENVAGCVIRAFLQRFGTHLEHPVFFNNSGYNMIVPDKVKVPLENNSYAVASGDLNPIHTNPYFATLTKLPSTITHGMWTSANARRVVEAYVAKKGERVVDFHTEFVGMVQSGDVLVTRVKHVGMKNGRLLVEIRTECEQTGEVVLKGTADIAGATTSYVFTGQGSAEVNMGMDLYSSSSVAKAIWDAADVYFVNKYGFSILNIVRTNPKETEIFFGGKNGEMMRSNYQQLTQQVQVRDEATGKLVTKQLPLFPQITDNSSSFTFRHPDGLLFATQFSQPALVLVELAAFSDLRDKGMIPSDCIFAGHSLGEYAALASVASVLSTESLVDIVFLRGMTMQNAVVRDEAGRSPYAMVAVNTGRVHPTHFREAQLNQVIQAIVKARPELLQVVNYNVDNYQYVVAGERGNLNALGFVLNALHKKLSGGGAQALAALSAGSTGAKGSTSGLADTPEMQALLEHAITQALDARDPVTGVIPLERGMATIPLPGIDVPFHSRFLKDGVPPFRQILQQRMNCQALNKDLLIGRYIPNVTAAPFSLAKSYIAEVQENTQSAILAEVLANFEQESLQPQQLAFKLLIELLAYQFASPVRWIETQHLFFSTLNVERFIEIGPAPTLFAMAKRTLETGQFSPLVSREILWYGRDKANIYYQGTDVEAEEPEVPVAPVQRAATPAPVVVPQALVVSSPAPVASAAAVPDSSTTGLEFIQTLVSIRLKKPVASVSASETIKAIVAGKSALQNELLGDLETEFGTKMPEGASDASLDTLAKQMSANYKQLGKVGTTITHKLVSNKMPGGFGMSQVKTYLNKQFGLGDGRIQSVLLHAASMEPAARLASDSEAHAFLDSCVSTYGARIGQTFAPASSVSVAASAPAFAAPASSGPASIPDEPIRAVDSLRIMVSLKVKKSLDLVPASSTIKELVGGKSALQNELIGDIQKEFGTEPGDGAAELDLAGLAGRVGGSYNKPGPYLGAAINKLVSTKMPGGYGLSSVKSYLSGRFGFGEGRLDSVLVHALALEPPNRLGTEGDAQAYLDQVAQDYASKHGVTLGSSGGGSAVARAGSAIDSAALKAFETRYHTLVKDLMRVYHDYLGEDPLASHKLQKMHEDLTKQAENQLAIWQAEHGEGDDYFDGIKPVFDVKKERRYNSSWNWNRQDCLQLYYDYACGRATQWTIDIRERLYHIKNRATPSVVELVEHYLNKKSTDDGHGEIKAFIQILADTLRFVMDDLPRYREHRPPTQPSVMVGVNGMIQYREVPRPGVKDMEAYVHEMHRGPQFGQIRAVLEESRAVPSTSAPQGTVASHVGEMQVAIKQLGDALDFLKKQQAPESVVNGVVLQMTKLEEALRIASASSGSSNTSPAPAASPKPSSLLPYLFLRQSSRVDPSHRSYHEGLTTSYLTALMKMASEGVSLNGKVALVIGCGKGSIGVEVVKALLQAGAKVYATTSRFSADSSSFYHKLFDRNGSKHSELVVLPFNQGSVQDVQALVKYIYDVEKSDLDYIVPFAALPENGRDIGDIDGRSELAHRIMLTNVLRLIGAIKEKKRALAITSRPAHVLLPMSPNHGIFGFDGLYAESKLGLEALLNKWHSEGWRQYLSLAGAVIGWTRGTGLMNQNNVVAAGIESMGARTFNASEMAFNLMGLLHPDMVVLAQNEPVLADLNGCLHLVPQLNVVVSDLRASLIAEASLKKAVVVDSALDQEVATGKRSNPISTAPISVTRRANITVPFPAIPTQQTLSAGYTKARGMVDLENVVVIAGFGEIGPYGSSRTRWEMESYGEFSIEGCIELAWMMGLIKYQADGAGWQDTKTGERVRDDQVKAKYEPFLLAHTGIRLLEPELFGGYDPHNKMFLHQVALNSDMAPLEVSAEEARAFKQRHGDSVDIYQADDNPDAWFVKLNKGSVLYIPKAMKFDRFVAGQVPSTWNPSILGIPQDIINQVDRVTLFSLASTVEALVSAGMTDPYEFYQYIHVSELGNTFGGGFGGMEAIRRTYRNRLLELPVQGDILQETFINTVGAWLNMLLLSSSGPIKTPVGACATAVESVEIGVDTIKSGKAKVVIVGGYDDFGEEGSYEFANMKATASSADEIAKGRTPREMSRPTTSTRAGFVESQGAGTQILMTAALAIQMGVPIYGIVEHVSTATDKVGRSVPAPGQGILTTARENHTRSPGFVSPLMDVEYRRKHLQMELKLIDQWSAFELAELEKIEVQTTHSELSATSGSVVPDVAPSSASSCSSSAPLPEMVVPQTLPFSPLNEAEQDAMRGHIAFETARRKRIAYSTWGNDFYRNNPMIAPLRGALAVYGLNIDDIAVASFHGTGTKGNDLNESQVVQKQLEHLGRSKGNVILTIFQKYLTGHPKGAAAAWMMNGLLQSMLTGIVPGNRNADNIDPKLRDCSHVVFLNRSLHTYGFKAGLLKSFGFGQVGGEVLVIHPNFVLGQLSELELRQYAEKRAARQNSAYRHWQNAITDKARFIGVKDHAPYSPEDESRVYLDPLARASYDTKQKTWAFPASRNARRASTLTGTSSRANPASSSSSSGQTASASSPSQSTLAVPQSGVRNANGRLSPVISTSASPSLGLGSRRAGTPTTASSSSSSSSGSLKRNISASALNHMEVMMREMGEGLRTTIDRGIGVDAQSIDEIDACVTNTDFVARNFTVGEIAYCRASPDPSSSFAGRWAAKEAVVKAISSCDSDNLTARNMWQGAGAPLKDIEILPSSSGAPVVQLSGHAADVAGLLSITTIKVAISHSGDYAIAQAIAR
jgi:fatty acid synthase subunit beta